MKTEETQGSWLRSGAYSLLEKGAGLIFGLGSLFLLTRILEEVDFGIWIAFSIISAFVEVGRAGLQQNGFVKYLSTAKDKKEEGEISTASFFNATSVTILSVVLIYLFAEGFELIFKNSEGLAFILRIYCVTTIVLIFFQQFNFTQQAKFKFEGIFWSNATYKGLFFFYVLYFFLSKGTPDLIQLAWFQVYAAIAAAAVSYFFARKYVLFSRSINWTWVKTLFDFGRFGFGTNMSTMLHKNLDKVMLAMLLGSTFLPIYEWAVRLTLIIEVPTFSIASVVYPKSSQAMKEDGKVGLKKLYEKSVGAIMAIILPFVLFIFLFAHPIILLLATEKYIAAVPVLRVTMLFGFFIPYAIMFGTVIDSMGKPKLNFLFTAAGFILNLFANYICITNFGVIGAAYGTLLSWCILVISGQIVLNNLLGIQWWKPFTHIIPFYRDAIQKILSYLNTNLLTKEKRI